MHVCMHACLTASSTLGGGPSMRYIHEDKENVFKFYQIQQQLEMRICTLIADCSKTFNWVRNKHTSIICRTEISPLYRYGGSNMFSGNKAEWCKIKKLIARHLGKHGAKWKVFPKVFLGKHGAKWKVLFKGIFREAWCKMKIRIIQVFSHIIGTVPRYYVQHDHCSPFPEPLHVQLHVGFTPGRPHPWHSFHKKSPTTGLGGLSPGWRERRGSFQKPLSGCCWMPLVCTRGSSKDMVPSSL